MNGSMNDRDNTDDQDLASLLCARICHDLVSPVGAINNGLELLETCGPGGDGAEMRLVKDSAEAAASALKFLRLAFGRCDGSETLPAAEIDRIARDHLGRGRFTAIWSSADTAIVKTIAQLSLNMMMSVSVCLPRGGVVRAHVVGRKVEVRGEADRISADNRWVEILQSGVRASEAESRETPFLMSYRLAATLGVGLRIEQSDKLIVLST